MRFQLNENHKSLLLGAIAGILLTTFAYLLTMSWSAQKSASMRAIPSDAIEGYIAGYSNGNYLYSGKVEIDSDDIAYDKAVLLSLAYDYGAKIYSERSESGRGYRKVTIVFSVPRENFTAFYYDILDNFTVSYSVLYKVEFNASNYSIEEQRLKGIIDRYEELANKIASSNVSSSDVNLLFAIAEKEMYFVEKLQEVQEKKARALEMFNYPKLEVILYEKTTEYYKIDVKQEVEEEVYELKKSLVNLTVKLPITLLRIILDAIRYGIYALTIFIIGFVFYRIGKEITRRL